MVGVVTSGVANCLTVLSSMLFISISGLGEELQDMFITGSGTDRRTKNSS